MRGRSIVARVVGATVIVALVSSLTLAAVAALTAWALWGSSERTALDETAAAFARTIRDDMRERHEKAEDSATRVIEESPLVGYQLELWRGETLLVKKGGDPIGPPPGRGLVRGSDWVYTVRELPNGLKLMVAAPREYGFRALSVFGWSLLLSAPPCLVLAMVVGWLAGRKATRPLVDFTERVSRMGELREVEADPAADVPSEVHDLEQSFRELLRRLMQTLSRELEFAANASHELRTPLTAIRLHAERAMEDAGAVGKEELSEQLRELDRMVRLIDALLVMARDADSGLPRQEVVNVADVLRDAGARVFPMPDAATIGAPDEALAWGDENLLGVAIENLLDNARKFTPAGQKVRVALGESLGRVTLLVVSPSSRISSAERERLFERFYRDPEARARHPGHGLGLPLSRHVARLHGGDVRCTSSPDEDACFVLELPSWQPQADSRAAWR